MDQEEYNDEKTPELDELRKQLSKANRLRHQYWTQLRSVRNQILRFIRLREIESLEDFENSIRGAPEENKEDLQVEWEMARKIPAKELERMHHYCDFLWSMSQFEEEQRRELSLTGAKFFVELEERRRRKLSQDRFILGPTCSNCQLPVPPGRKRYCSDVCAEQYRKRKYKRTHKTKYGERPHLEIGKQEPRRPVKALTPQPGVGQKNTGCQYSYHCMDAAVALKWENYHCENCILKDSR